MKKLVSLLLVVLVLLPTNVLLAQDSADTQSIELPNGQSVTIGADWAFEDQDGVYVFTRNETDMITLILPENTAPYYADSVVAPTAAELLLILSAEEVIPHAISESDIELIDLGAEYTYSEGSNYGEVQVLAWGDGFAYQEIVAKVTEFGPLRTIAADLLTQLGYMAPEMGTAAECFVSTDNAWGAAMRLGPSLNRGEYTSLMPADGEILVLAQNVDENGGIWWRVEEDYDAVAELWVSDADVTTSGNCAMVGEEAGQGIVMPVGPPPPAAPASPGSGDAGGDTGGDTGGTGSTGAVNTSLIPASGTWRWIPSSEMLLSCEGTGTVHAPNPVPSFGGIISLTASADGTSLTVFDGGAVYNFTGGNGFYTAHGYTFSDGIGVLFLRVSSPTVMSMEISIIPNGIPCSGTVPVTTTYIG